MRRWVVTELGERREKANAREHPLGAQFGVDLRAGAKASWLAFEGITRCC